MAFRAVRILNGPILDELLVSRRASAVRSLGRDATSISRSRM